MGRICSVCSHPDRAVIDRSLIAGTPQTEIAREHGVSQAALSRHLHRHAGPEVAHALGRYEEADRERLGSYANGLLNEALVGMVRAKAAGDAAEVRAWMAEARKNLELRARLGQVIGNERVKIDMADAQKQMRVLAGLDEDELRRLAAADTPALGPGTATPPLHHDGTPLADPDAETHAVTQTAELAAEHAAEHEHDR